MTENIPCGIIHISYFRQQMQAYILFLIRTAIKPVAFFSSVCLAPNLPSLWAVFFNLHQHGRVVLRCLCQSCLGLLLRDVVRFLSLTPRPLILAFKIRREFCYVQSVINSRDITAKK